jgi:transposase-like protein
VRAAHLIMEGLSLSTIGHKFGVSKEAVRQWRIKFEEAFSSKPLSKVKERPIILLDETKVKRDGKNHMVCPSVVLDLSWREVISTQTFRSRSSFSTIAVMEQALKLCESRPIVLVDHAPAMQNVFPKLTKCRSLFSRMKTIVSSFVQSLKLSFSDICSITAIKLIL